MAAPQQRLTLTRPDDWHVHLRDGAAMAAVLQYTATQFARAIVMPNLRPPITTTAVALAYKQRIVAALNVSAPRFRFSTRLPRAGKQVKAAADELSVSLGWDGSILYR